MHADVVVNHEFETCQADTGIRQLTEVECQMRVTDVHHDLRANGWQFATQNFGYFGFQNAVVDFAFVAFGARYGDERTVFEHLGRITTAHHRRYAQLARNDRGVTGTATTVGNNGGCALHHRLPVRVGHVSDQDIARLYAFHFGRIHDNAHRARTNFLTDGTTGSQHGDVIGIGFQSIALFGFTFGLAFHGFRTRLQDVDFAIATVFTPFDVHWAAVVLFDNHGIFGQLGDVFVRNGVAIARFERHIDGFHAAFFARLSELHFDEFGAHGATDHRGFALRQGGFEHVEFVGIDRALHHRFTQTVAGGDEYDLVKTRFGVHGEHDAR